MDPGVLEAMRRWPNVPAVYGWLSLTPRGEWRLHPLGDAMQGGYGEGISNTQILSFINRNYVSGQDGTWFFQNGPQRVYVELESTPLIWRVAHDGQVTAHTGQSTEVRECLLDEEGHLYLNTTRGLGLVHSLDVAVAADLIEQGRWTVHDCLRADLPQRFGFVISPQQQVATAR